MTDAAAAELLQACWHGDCAHIEEGLADECLRKELDLGSMLKLAASAGHSGSSCLSASCITILLQPLVYLFQRRKCFALERMSHPHWLIRIGSCAHQPMSVSAGG